MAVLDCMSDRLTNSTPRHCVAAKEDGPPSSHPTGTKWASITEERGRSVESQCLAAQP